MQPADCGLRCCTPPSCPAIRHRVAISFLIFPPHISPRKAPKGWSGTCRGLLLASQGGVCPLPSPVFSGLRPQAPVILVAVLYSPPKINLAVGKDAGAWGCGRSSRWEEVKEGRTLSRPMCLILSVNVRTTRHVRDADAWSGYSSQYLASVPRQWDTRGKRGTLAPLGCSSSGQVGSHPRAADADE